MKRKIIALLVVAGAFAASTGNNFPGLGGWVPF